jgi:hypothetical protein
MHSDIRDKMNQWSRWRQARITNGLKFPAKTILGKMMDGMPGTICPLCRGHDDECAVCEGSGRVKLDPGGAKVNPAFIGSTYRQPDDPQSQTIDRLVCELRAGKKTQKYFFVIWEEYCARNGTQEIKASRIHISHEYYRTLLKEAHKLLEIGIQNVSKKSEKETHNAA